MYQGFARTAPLAGRRRRLLWRFAPAVLLAALLLGGSVSPAVATVTIGSNLARQPNSAANYSPRPTFSNVSLASDRRAPGGLSSPVTGTVVRWRIRVGGSTRVTNFRIIRPLGGGLFTGAGTSPSVTPPIHATTSYGVQLPIRIGDYIGLDCCDPDFFEPDAEFFVTGGAAVRNEWQPGLADGGPGRAPLRTNPYEIALNAEINPTSTFTLGAITRNKKNGHRHDHRQRSEPWRADRVGQGRQGRQRRRHQQAGTRTGQGAAADQGEGEEEAEAELDRQGEGEAGDHLHPDRRRREHPVDEGKADEAVGALVLPLSIRLKVAAVGVAGALSLLGASAAQAATVTLGSPLTNALPSSPIAISATVQQTALPGATLVAPFNGQITSWKVIDASVAGRFRSFTHLAAGSSARGRHMAKRSDRGSSPSPPACPSGRATASAWPPIPPAPLSETVAPPQARPSISMFRP